MRSNRRFRFSNKAVDSLPPHPREAASREAEYSDTEVSGLRLLVSKNGRKHYLLRFSIDGRKGAIKLGEHGPLGVTDARKKANELKALVADGVDPRVERNRRREAPTFRLFAEQEYLPFAKQRKKSWRSDESKLRNWLYGRFGDLKVNAIGTPDVRRYISELAMKRSKATANRHLALLSSIFRLAMAEGIVDRNPCKGVQQYREVATRDDHFFTPEEARRYVEAAWDYPNRTMGALLVFLLATGLRRGEASKLEWNRVDLERRYLVLKETKACKVQHVPLNDAALAVLQTLPRRSRWVFPQRANPEKPIDNPTKAHRAILKAAGLPQRYVIHSLRHGFASLLVASGRSLYEVQHLLRHATPKQSQAYAHLAADHLREASNEACQVLMPIPSQEARDGSAGNRAPLSRKRGLRVPSSTRLR